MKNKIGIMNNFILGSSKNTERIHFKKVKNYLMN